MDKDTLVQEIKDSIAHHTEKVNYPEDEGARQRHSGAISALAWVLTKLDVDPSDLVRVNAGGLMIHISRR
jgi:hypothetical protein